MTCQYELSNTPCTLALSEVPPETPGPRSQVLSQIPEKCPGSQTQLQRALLPALLHQLSPLEAAEGRRILGEEDGQ